MIIVFLFMVPKFIFELIFMYVLDCMNEALLKFVTAANSADLNVENEASIVNYYSFNNSLTDNFEENLSAVEGNYRCQRCHKTFKYRTSCEQHVCEGNSQKKFRCKECGKMLARKSSLIGHLRIHTGEKPFQCEHCGKAFTHKHHLHSHMHTHRMQEQI